MGRVTASESGESVTVLVDSDHIDLSQSIWSLLTQELGICVQVELSPQPTSR
jgi:hypothetical protein